MKSVALPAMLRWAPAPKLAENSIHATHRPNYPFIHFFIFLFCLSDGHGTTSEVPAAGTGRGKVVATTNLADAPGGPLPAGVSCPAGEGHGFRRTVHDARSGSGRDAAADPPLSLRRRNPVQRYPDGSLGARPARRLSRRRRARAATAARRDGGGGATAGAVVCRDRADPGNGAAGAFRVGDRRVCRLHADRLRRRAVHRRLLHGRGRRLAGFRRDADHGVRPAGAVRPADRAADRGDGELSVGADRCRRRDGDAVRYLGRHSLAQPVPSPCHRTGADDRRCIAPASSRGADHRLSAAGRPADRRLRDGNPASTASGWTLRWTLASPAD